MLRQPTPCVAILGDYLLMTDSAAALQEAIKTQRQPAQSLANELDYKLIASKIKRQVGGDAPGMVQFSRPEEGLRFWYDLATSDNTQADASGRGREQPLPAVARSGPERQPAAAVFRAGQVHGPRRRR